jgi:hypothetical protein
MIDGAWLCASSERPARDGAVPHGFDNSKISARILIFTKRDMLDLLPERWICL